MNAHTFKDLIGRHHWLSIEATLISLYPDEGSQLEAYRKVFGHLMKMSPKPSNVTIRLTQINDDEDDYVSVDGYYMDGRVDKQSGNDALALDFTPWNEWLDMVIDARSQKEFTELEIISHCLYEMTFNGFEEEEIKSQLDDLKRIVEEYEQMTPEERKRNTRSLDDLLNDTDNR